MISKFSRFVLLAFVLVVSANTAFAEGDPAIVGGDVNCSGKVMGKTIVSNPNFGQLDFDSHPSPYSDANQVTDLSIVVPPPPTKGLAPADRNLAACLDAKTSVAVPLVSDEYVVKGYAWNTNLGFFSFFCDGGKNQGVDCGGFKYGVKISKPDGNGARLLSGNAWNPSFGYMQFSDEGGAIKYQVSMDKDGKLSGYAWTEAKVWVNMSGITMQIPGKKIVPEAVVVGPCAKKPFVCVYVPDPEKALDKILNASNGSGGIKIGQDPDIKVANGVDYYEIHLYLMEADGVTPMDVGKYNVGPITFSWSDTVKRTQGITDVVGTSLDNVAEPWKTGTGGIIYKPITASLSDFDDLKDGHYVLKQKIKSYAPTTDMNISFTTSMKPNVAFKNEVFFNTMTTLGDGLKPPVVKEANRLRLSKMDIPLTDKVTGQPPVAGGVTYNKVIYPNGKDGLLFHFRPAVEVSTLYTGNSSDSISGFRSIPFSFKVGGKKDSKLVDGGTASVGFYLDYDKELTINTCKLVNGQEVTSGGFKVGFAGDGESVRNIPVDEKFGSFDLQAVAKLLGYDDLSDEEKAKAGIEKPCDQVLGPSLYTVVKYFVDGLPVTFFSNHLPRVASALSNPVAVVHGNLYAAKAFSPSAAAETQETGSKSVNIVRDGVYENIAGKISGIVLEKDPIVAAGNTKISTVGDNGSSVGVSPVSKTTVEGTSVSVYKNTDVHVNLSNPASYSDNQAIVVMNGNVFIDSDIYKAAPSTDKMQIVVLRPYSSGCNKGNVYIKNTVKNINANVFTDCSVFSYMDGLPLDSVTGVPKWADFSQMVEELDTQLRWLGSIASHNSVGGSDLDKDLKNPKTYLFDGFRAWDTVGLSSEKRLEIQAYDLNYLRLFKLSIQTNELGMPIDQSCKKALTLEEMLQVKQNQVSQDVDEEGNIIPPPVYGENGELCDGIDALSSYDLGNGFFGDLVAPVDDVTLAKGLDAETAKGDYKPVYVIFSVSTSPLFER
ncbi:MAG: hypothetical protein WC651_00150 [Candidatus Gracilibacteria bacterium]|jgi:hypothetical protein